MEIVRLAGPPAVGKSTVAWLLAQSDAAAGIPVAYVDIDQLGMCYPAPEGDPDRWVLKERALRQLAPVYAAAGAARLIVSGVADPGSPPPLNSTYPTKSVWLDANPAARSERLAARGWSPERVAEVTAIGTAESAAADAGWARVSTDDRMPQHTASDTQALLATLPAAVASAIPDAPIAMPERVLWLTGARLVGTSTIGWVIANEAWAAGRRTGFIDAEQLGFAWNLGRTLGAANAGELGRVVAAAGAADLVVVAPLDINPDDPRATLPEAEFTLVRLTADDASRRERAYARRAGGGQVLAGDDVFAASDAALDAVLQTGATETPLRTGEVRLDASDLGPAEAAARLRECAGW